MSLCCLATLSIFLALRLYIGNALINFAHQFVIVLEVISHRIINILGAHHLLCRSTCCLCFFFVECFATSRIYILRLELLCFGIKFYTTLHSSILAKHVALTILKHLLVHIAVDVVNSLIALHNVTNALQVSILIFYPQWRMRSRAIGTIAATKTIQPFSQLFVFSTRPHVVCAHTVLSLPCFKVALIGFSIRRMHWYVRIYLSSCCCVCTTFSLTHCLLYLLHRHGWRTSSISIIYVLLFLCQRIINKVFCEVVFTWLVNGIVLLPFA